MSPLRSRTRASFLPPSTCSIVAAFALLALMGGPHNPAMAAQARDCDKQITAVTSSADALPESIRAVLARRVSKASALSRFHRRDDALAQLDLLATLLAGPRGQQVQDDSLTKLTKSIDVLRRCLATMEPPPLASLTIRAVREGGTPAEEGVFLDVEGVRVGRSGSDGTLEVKVPSGTIRIEATEYPSSDGSDVVTIPPGGSQVATVVMADSKEPKEDSDLVLEEAPDDILPANPASVTLKFVQDDLPVTLDHIEGIEIGDDRGEAGESVEEFFAVSDGAIRAKVPSAVYRRMAEHVRIGRPLWLAVSAVDTEGRFHYGSLPFQIGQFRLNVALAPPPSNPALQVSNIRVRVSVVGTNIALRRTSDAHGRFQIEALPDTTLGFDAHTVASGTHYYVNSTLTMCADRSVTLLMMNVKDLVAGVRGLILDAGTPPCPHVPRR
jgi:hypothetical protein